MRGRSDEAQAAIARLEASRAPERARLAAKPTHNWLETDRFRMEASAPDAPKPMQEKPKRGRPPKVRS